MKPVSSSVAVCSLLFVLSCLLQRTGLTLEKPDAKSKRELPEGVKVSADIVFHAPVLDAKTRKPLYEFRESQRAGVRVTVQNKNGTEVAITMDQVAPDSFYVTDEGDKKLATVAGSFADRVYDVVGKFTLRSNANLKLLVHPFSNVAAVLFDEKGVYYLRHETHSNIRVCFELDGEGGMVVLDRQ